MSSATPLKYLLTNVVEKQEGDSLPFVALQHIESGTGRLVDSFDWSPTAPGDHALFRPGDILFGKLRPYLRKVLAVDRAGCCPTELLVLRPRSGVDTRFAYYLIQSDYVVSYAVATSYGVKMPRTSWDVLGRLSLRVPSTAEQRAIAAYLDRETARIDALLDNYIKLSNLLEERVVGATGALALGRRSQSERTKYLPVAGGLFVPENWQVVRGKRLFDLIDERSSTGAEELLSLSYRTGVTLTKDRSESEHRLEAETLVGYKRCQAGDLLLNRLMAFRGAVHVTPYEGIVSPEYVVLRPHRHVPVHLLAAIYRTPWYVAEYQRRSRGIGDRHLRLHAEDFLDIPVPVPPLDETQAILAGLEAETARSIRAVRIVASIRTRLLERRQALITAAVTGQIDVSQVAA